MSLSKIYQNNLLTLTVNEDDASVQINFSGKSIEREPGKFISPLFVEYSQIALDKKKTLILDFSNIEYMNSSTITPVIKFLDKMRNMKQRTLVLYKDSLKWQKLSFQALFIFKTTDDLIDIRGI